MWNPETGLRLEFHFETHRLPYAVLTTWNVCVLSFYCSLSVQTLYFESHDWHLRPHLPIIISKQPNFLNFMCINIFLWAYHPCAKFVLEVQFAKFLLSVCLWGYRLLMKKGKLEDAYLPQCLRNCLCLCPYIKAYVDAHPPRKTIRNITCQIGWPKMEMGWSLWMPLVWISSKVDHRESRLTDVTWMMWHVITPNCWSVLTLSLTGWSGAQPKHIAADPFFHHAP